MFAFDDPHQYIFDPNLRFVQLKGVLEERPHLRNEVALTLGYLQYLPRQQAALHLQYRLYTDDWGIVAHTFDADWRQPLGRGWMAVPEFRYYSQSKAELLPPVLSVQPALPGFPGVRLARLEQIRLSYFSSDERLSAFGALSGGLSVEKTLASGLTVAVGYDYYVHAGGLTLSGGGEHRFADFDASSVHVGFRVRWSAAPSRPWPAMARVAKPTVRPPPRTWPSLRRRDNGEHARPRRRLRCRSALSGPGQRRTHQPARPGAQRSERAAAGMRADRLHRGADPPSPAGADGGPFLRAYGLPNPRRRPTTDRGADHLPVAIVLPPALHRSAAGSQSERPSRRRRGRRHRCGRPRHPL